MRSSSGCCPGLGKPLGFQPVFACVSKSLEEILTENAQQYVALLEGFIGDRIGDARIFGAARAENKSKNLFFAESRQK